MPRNVQRAAAIARVDAVLGDARRLDEPDAAYQATLLLGPLYHLPERRDRVPAMREAARVTASGWLGGDDRTVALLDALHSAEQEPSLFVITSHLLTAAVVK